MTKTIPAVTMPNYFDEAKQSYSGQATPLEILDSAAKQLAGQTNGFVTGSVYVATYLGSVRYTFNMVMPRLNGYTCQRLSVPVVKRNSQELSTRPARNNEGFT